MDKKKPPDRPPLTTKMIRDDALEAFYRLGGVKFFLNQGCGNSAQQIAFMNLLSKFIPQEIKAELAQAVKVVIVKIAPEDVKNEKIVHDIGLNEQGLLQ